MIKKFGIILITSSVFMPVCFAQVTLGDLGVVASIKAFNKDFNDKSQGVLNGYYNPQVTTNPVSPAPLSIIYTPYLNEVQAANEFSTQSPASQDAATDTANNLTNSLTHFVYDLQKSPDSDTPDPFQLNLNALVQTQPGQYNQIPFKQYAKDNSVANLTIGTPSSASDTLYMTENQLNTARSNDKISTDDQAALKKPTATYDNYLNFANLFESTNYKATQNGNQESQNPQLQAANKYVVYAAQSTKNFAGELELNALKPYPKGVASLKNFVGYQKYAMTVRTLLAIRSIAIDTLQHLIAERTPHPKWGKAIGDPNKDGTASPLQVEAYQANHRIQNPNWYQSIMNDAPITVQRTIAIELAEIEHQNYQAHLDRERILAAITASNLASNLSSDTLLTQQAQTVNSFIQSQIPTQKPLTSDSPKTTAPQPTFKAETTKP